MTTVSIETDNIARLIKERRVELGLSVEDAAHKAGVGVKTWYRYESGSPIRVDKVKNVCRALNWSKLPGQEELDFSEYKNLETWDAFVEANFGVVAALFLAHGMNTVWAYIEEDLERLSEYPKNTHIGELPYSWLAEHLPQQFLMEYDYAFLYKLRAEMAALKRQSNVGVSSVIQEILLYLSDFAGKTELKSDKKSKD